jgi:1,4-alpha-glucan branching enzyme
MWAHPGKKLLFMGGEFGQVAEWSHDVELAWSLLNQPEHRGLQRLVADLNGLYRTEGALHHTDADPRGFEWIAENEGGQSLFAFIRKSFHGAAPIVAALNFTPVPRNGWRLGVPFAGRWQVELNSDASAYGGSDTGSRGMLSTEQATSHGQAQSLVLDAPPLGALILRYEGPAA